MIRTAALPIAAAYLVLALVPAAGVIQAALDPAWRAPFPVEVMALFALWLLATVAAWLGVRGGRRAGVLLATLSGVLGIVVGLIGFWGAWVSVGEPCSGAPAAVLATSWPLDACEQARSGGSLLVGGYLIAIGILSGIALAVLDQLRGRSGGALR